MLVVGTDVQNVPRAEHYDQLRTEVADENVREHVPAIGMENTLTSLSISPQLLVHLPSDELGQRNLLK